MSDHRQRFAERLREFRRTELAAILPPAVHGQPTICSYRGCGGPARLAFGQHGRRWYAVGIDCHHFEAIEGQSVADGGGNDAGGVSGVDSKD